MSVVEKDDEVTGKAHAYTPGLKVKRLTSVSKTRRLPMIGKVLVSVGDEVKYDAIVAETSVPGDPVVANVAAELNIDPENLKRHMVKGVGDGVTEGEIIARYKGLFGLFERKVTSPCYGSVEAVSDFTGQVTLRGASIPVHVDAYIPGKITEVIPDEGAVVTTNACFIQGIFGVGGETHGTLKVNVDSPDEALTADRIGEDDKDLIIAGGSLVTIDAIRKASELGVRGIIVGAIGHEDLIDFMGSQVGVAITGQEEVGLTLVITEGFGKLSMADRTFGLLKEFEGSFVSMNGATQIRAGVIRPEIIIPHERSEGVSEAGDVLDSGMVPGTLVRIIREPYFGSIGTVSSLPVQLQEVKTGSSVRVLEVALEDGRKVVVPRANVEIIEE